MEKIFYKDILIGIKISTFPKGSVPCTESEEALGLLTLRHPRGTYLKAHVHKPVKRVSTKLQECFIVRQGKVRMDLYGPDKKFFKYIFLSAGQAFIALNGGHGFHFLTDSELWETKNGPFKEDKVFITTSYNKT